MSLIQKIATSAARRTLRASRAVEAGRGADRRRLPSASPDRIEGGHVGVRSLPWRGSTSLLGTLDVARRELAREVLLEDERSRADPVEQQRPRALALELERALLVPARAHARAVEIAWALLVVCLGACLVEQLEELAALG